jgi:hypothetical protein
LRAGYLRNTLLVGLACAVTVVTVPGVAQAADAYYAWYNFKSEKFLQPINSSTANGASIVIASSAGGSTPLPRQQKWLFKSTDGFVNFVNQATGKSMGVDGASTAPGAKIIQANRSDAATNQQWRMVRSTTYNGFYLLKNRKSGLCVGISNGSTSEIAQAAQFSCDEAAKNQLFADVAR